MSITQARHLPSTTGLASPATPEAPVGHSGPGSLGGTARKLDPSGQAPGVKGMSDFAIRHQRVFGSPPDPAPAPIKQGFLQRLYNGSRPILKGLLVGLAVTAIGAAVVAGLVASGGLAAGALAAGVIFYGSAGLGALAGIGTALTVAAKDQKVAEAREQAYQKDFEDTVEELDIGSAYQPEWSDNGSGAQATEFGGSNGPSAGFDFEPVAPREEPRPGSDNVGWPPGY